MSSLEDKLTECSKTEIAIEYCYRSWHKEPATQIFWVSCDNREKMDLSFKEIALRLALPGHDDADMNMTQLVCRHLQQHCSFPWLMVLDNADDAEILENGEDALARHVPNFKHGSVIVTTRDREVGQALTGKAHRSLKIDRLSPKDALKLFRHRLPDDTKLDEPLELQILSILEYLPLCITQAAAYIDVCDLNLQDYFSELSESEATLIKSLNEEHRDFKRGRDTPNSVLRAWKLSFDRIHARYKQASRVLSVMGFLDRQYINRDLLVGVVDNLHDLNRALGTLQGFCLIVPEPSRESYRMHRLVQLATRFWCMADRIVYEALALKLVSSRFCELANDPTSQMRLIPHAKLIESYRFQDTENNLNLAELQHCIAACYQQAGKYDLAAVACKEAYDKRATLLGKSHIDTLHTGGLLGVIKRYQGQFKEACSLQYEILIGKELALGKDDPDTIDTVHDLADVYERQWQFDDAQPLTERALTARLARFGERHPKTLQSMMHLALLNRRRTHYDKSEVYYRRALTAYEAILGPDHESTLDCADALSSLLREWGRYKESTEVSQRVANGKKNNLGEEHPRTLLARNNLALSYWREGDLTRAEQEARDVCAMHDKLHRQDHIDALQAYSNLSIILLELTKYDEAEVLARRALAGRKALFGPDHLLTISTAAELAVILLDKGAYEESEQLALRVLAVREKVLGPRHPITLNTKFTLASVKQNTERSTEAIDILKFVLEARTEKLGANHPLTKQVADRLTSLDRDANKD
jgi:tetratricopeptide (TPR) repeat protein